MTYGTQRMYDKLCNGIPLCLDIMRCMERSPFAGLAPLGKTIWNHFSICACHPCAGAMLIFSVSFQVYQMSPKTQRGEGLNGINSPQLSQGKTDGGVGLEDGTTPRHRLTRMPGKAASWASRPARVEKGPWACAYP